MTYVSVDFIFFLLAGATIALALPHKFRNWWLLAMSFTWMASWKPEWALLFFVLSNINFFVQKKATDRIFQGLLIFDIAVFLILRKGSVFDWEFIPPYGTSFILFIIMGQVLERWRNQDREEYSWVEYMLFSQFFLFLMGGPIERATKFIGELRKENRFQLVNLVDGILIMGTGFIKIIILWSTVTAFAAATVERVNHWALFIPLGLISTWKVYLELSGLADIGRGGARILGIHASINFRPILFSRSPVDFWLRWNITVGTWFRNNVTIPLMLNWGRTIPRDFIIFGSFILMGIWHGVGFQHVLFGLFNGAMIVFYNWSEGRKFPKWWGVVLAIILMIGNGILSNLIYLKLSPVTSLDLGPIFLRHFDFAVIVTLVLLLIYEILQEVKKDVDFILSYPLWVKSILSLAFLFLLFYALDHNLLTKHKVMDLPIYFKI
ncbi:MAG: MBOAT family O-acyltransferase [Bdellovibrionota bacterium]